jgi:hypothetical protein
MKQKIIQLLQWIKQVSLNYESDEDVFIRMTQEYERVMTHRRLVSELRSMGGYTVLF